MNIRDDGTGWKVYAQWHGQERVVYAPESMDPWIQMALCNNFVKENS